jgi:hypothetical protein
MDTDRILRLVFEYQGHDGRWAEIGTFWFHDPRSVLYVVNGAISLDLLAKITWRIRIKSVLTH